MERDGLAGDEERLIDRALKHCKQLEHTLRLSLVQVKLLNRKYCRPLPNHRTASMETPRSVRLSLSETHFRPTAVGSPQLQLTASSPDVRQSPARCLALRPLSLILLQSNEITVQLIKIRRHFEGILMRVEFLVRMYCKKSPPLSPMLEPLRQLQQQRRRLSGAAAKRGALMIVIGGSSGYGNDRRIAAVEARRRCHASCGN